MQKWIQIVLEDCLSCPSLQLTGWRTSEVTLMYCPDILAPLTEGRWAGIWFHIISVSNLSWHMYFESWFFHHHISELTRDKSMQSGGFMIPMIMSLAVLFLVLLRVVRWHSCRRLTFLLKPAEMECFHYSTAKSSTSIILVLTIHLAPIFIHLNFSFDGSTMKRFSSGIFSSNQSLS